MPNEYMTSSKALRHIEHVIILLRQRAMSVPELSEAMCIPRRRVGELITYLRRNPSLHGHIHIEGWQPVIGKGRSMARYRYGDGEDAQTPTQAVRKIKAKVPMTEEEADALIDRRFKAAALRKQAKYPIQRHWLIAALYGPEGGAQA